MAVKNLRINRCSCSICMGLDANHPERLRHYQINLLMSTMNTRQRRLFSAYEAKNIGVGGISKIARITGLDRKTIRRGVKELLLSVQDSI